MMTYLFFPWLHANVRYQTDALLLSGKEIEALLRVFDIHTEFVSESVCGRPALSFEAPHLSGEAISMLSCHSMIDMLFERVENGALRPLISRKKSMLGSDLPAILKYKGKTNERFTELLLNFALCASRFAKEPAIRFLDPMGGRGTGAFIAANRGFDAVCLDADKNAIHDAGVFFRQYLEHERLKHKREGLSQTDAKGPLPIVRYTYAATKEAYAAKDTKTLTFACADAARAAALGKGLFHVLTADLPYGVQHSASDRKMRFDTLLDEVLPAWHAALSRGGALAVSYNTYTLKTERVRELLAKHGFTPQEASYYVGCEHFVEQAVMRDLTVAVKD